MFGPKSRAAIIATAAIATLGIAAKAYTVVYENDSTITVGSNSTSQDPFGAWQPVKGYNFTSKGNTIYLVAWADGNYATQTQIQATVYDSGGTLVYQSAPTYVTKTATGYTFPCSVPGGYYNIGVRMRTNQPATASPYTYLHNTTFRVSY